MSTVGIVNYGMGNLTSVRNAFAAVGSQVRVLDQPAELDSVDRVVLPGVGAFGDGMKNLRARGWVEGFAEHVRERGKPFLGICLGLQLLATRGTEHGDHEGLGWIPGTVVRFPEVEHLRVPHVGWNDVAPAHRNACYREGFAEAGVFYFVHSFHLVPENDQVVDGWCEYGTRFAASLRHGNVWAVQYHPEKSQSAGLQVLRNFLAV